MCLLGHCQFCPSHIPVNDRARLPIIFGAYKQEAWVWLCLPSRLQPNQPPDIMQSMEEYLLLLGAVQLRFRSAVMQVASKNGTWTPMAGQRLACSTRKVWVLSSNCGTAIC